VTKCRQGQVRARGKPCDENQGGAESRAKAGRGKAGAFAREEADRVAAEQRRHYVEVAAYHIAERRGFAPGDPLEDWVQAEAEIDRLLAEGRSAGEYAPVRTQAGSNTSAASGGRVSDSEAGKPIQA
jgi:hypothetical protein